MAGRPDYLLAEKGLCAALSFQRLRTTGWVYKSPQEETVPPYRCYNTQEHSHFASNESDCEKLGKMEHLLGYVLTK